jgi:hypothetical protein
MQSQGEYIVIFVELNYIEIAGLAPERYLRRIIDKNFRYHYFFFTKNCRANPHNNLLKLFNCTKRNIYKKEIIKITTKSQSII